MTEHTRRNILATLGTGATAFFAGCGGESSSQPTTGSATTTGSVVSSATTDTESDNTSSATAQTDISTVKGSWTHRKGNPQQNYHLPSISGPTTPFADVWEMNFNEYLTHFFGLQDGVLYGTLGKHASAYDALTGERLWKSDIRNSSARGPLGLDNGKVVLDHGALSMDDGSKIWTSDVSSDSYEFLGTTLAGDIYGYRKPDDTRLLARANTDTGEIIWERTPTQLVDDNFTALDLYPCLSVGDSLIFNLAPKEQQGTDLVSLSKSDGTVNWRRRGNSPYQIPVCATESGVLVSEGEEDSRYSHENDRLLWISPDDGTVQWSQSSIVAGSTNNWWAADDSTLYTIEGPYEGNRMLVVAYSLADGSVQWEKDVTPETSVELSSSGFHRLFVTSDTLYAAIVPNTVSTPDGGVTSLAQPLSIDKASGKTNWELDTQVPILPTNNGLFTLDFSNVSMKFIVGR